MNQIKNALRDVRVAMLDSLQVINENTQRTNISDIAKDNKAQKAQAERFDQVVASLTEQIQKTGTALNEAMSA